MRFPAPDHPGTRLSGQSPDRPGFTLIEMLVAMAVFALLMVVLLSMISQSSVIWQRMQNESASYQSARSAFNLISRTLSQSRMNVYEDYDNPSQPTAYLRKSDLHFIIDSPQGADFHQGNSIFFQAPANRTLDASNYAGLPGLLNSVGYYVTYGKNPKLPAFLQKLDRNRFRLMQFLTPTEDMTAYSSGGKGWFQSALSTHSSVIADNVVLFLAWPRLSKEEDLQGDDLTQEFNGGYRYDSRQGASLSTQPPTANQQPPLVQITMVVIDETYANRLPDAASPPSEVTALLSGLFDRANEDDYRKDLAMLESRMNNADIGYRIFSTMVPLRETKWTK